MATVVTVIVGGGSLLMRSRRSLGCSLALVNFTLLDQRDRPKNCATEITAPTISPASVAENTIDRKTGIWGQ
jgi:hypothetical protein